MNGSIAVDDKLGQGQNFTHHYIHLNLICILNHFNCRRRRNLISWYSTCTIIAQQIILCVILFNI